MEYTLEFLLEKIKEVESVLNSLDENEISGTPERLQELKNTYSKQHIDLLCGIKFLEDKVGTSESGLNLCNVSGMLPKLNAIELTQVFGSTHCKYSVIEQKMKQLYENQEKILEAIKLVGNCR